MTGVAICNTIERKHFRCRLGVQQNRIPFRRNTAFETIFSLVSRFDAHANANRVIARRIEHSPKRSLHSCKLRRLSWLVKLAGRRRTNIGGKTPLRRWGTRRHPLSSAAPRSFIVRLVRRDYQKSSNSCATICSMCDGSMLFDPSASATFAALFIASITPQSK